MATDNGLDIRAEIISLLLDKIEESKYPSVTMLDMVEQLANPQERERYARALLERVQASRYPSIPMTRRLLALG